MKMIPVAIALAVLLSSDSPFAARPICFDEAEGIATLSDPQKPARRIPKPLDEIRSKIDELMQEAERLPVPTDRAPTYCVIAELMRRVGDTRAESFYQKAIQADSANAEFSLLFGDYLRNFRGPQQPLFPQAEAQYYEALRKADEPTKSRVHRSLIALYERDGLPLLDRIDRGRPFVLFSTQNAFGRLPTDIGEVDEIRDFASEALFAASRERLNRDLSQAELRGIIRAKEQFETFNRLKVRYNNLPVFDAFVQYRNVQDAQITNFFEPNRFNDIHLTMIGGALEKPINAYPFFDMLLRGEVRRIEREGLIEFLPGAQENVTSFIGRAVLSRFVGPDKANVELTVVSDDIDQQIDNPIKRRLCIVAPTLRYQLFRPTFLGAPFERPIAARGSEFFAGALFSEETFGTVDLRKQDYFGGLSLRGMQGLRDDQSFDITVQPTLLIAEREGRDAQGNPVEPLRNAHYRTFMTLLYRLIDRENIREVDEATPLVSLNGVFLGSHDLAVSGSKDFESFRVGTGLQVKLVRPALQGGTTFLAAARYELQRFFRLDKDEHLFLVQVSMGF